VTKDELARPSEKLLATLPLRFGNNLVF